jgi:hypothetical protein
MEWRRNSLLTCTSLWPSWMRLLMLQEGRLIFIFQMRISQILRLLPRIKIFCKDWNLRSFTGHVRSKSSYPTKIHQQTKLLKVHWTRLLIGREELLTLWYWSRDLRSQNSKRLSRSLSTPQALTYQAFKT